MISPEEKIRRVLKGNYTKKQHAKKQRHKIYSHFEYVDSDLGRAEQNGKKCLLGGAAVILILVIAILTTVTRHSTCK